MEKEQFLLILDRYLKGDATIAEQDFLFAYYNLFQADADVMQMLEADEQLRLKLQIREGIYRQIDHNDLQEEKRRIKQVRLWPRIGVAASLFLAVSIAIYFFSYRNQNKQEEDQNIAYKNDIAPGKVGATLTLANGKKIRLADAANGEVAKEAGISVTKTADGQLVYQIEENTNETEKINTLSTAKGETYILTLPDKSKVWLNAASSLTYSASLNERGLRRVRLEGEGYFEIAKDKAHPFVVESNGQEVEVLGTHFNVNAYSDEVQVKTTLLEGSVKVAVNGLSKILKPDQQAVLDKGVLTIKDVEGEDVIAWKNGLFVFEDEPLESVMRKIGRWYNVEIEYGHIDRTKRIGGGVSRYENVSAVLKQLELTKSVHFKIEGRKIIAEK